MILPVLAVAFSLAMASAASGATNGVYEYRDNSDGSITIISYLTNHTTNLVIPAVLDAKSVTAIGESAFQSKYLSGHVTLPVGVLDIGPQAFRNNTELHGVALGSSVTNISEKAFYVSKLRSLTLPDSVRAIGEDAFYYNNISNLVMGTNLTTIGVRAFMNNRALEEVVLPDSLVHISSNAFFDNDIHVLTFGSNLTFIGEEAFTQNQLTNGIVLPDSIEVLGKFAFYNTHLTRVQFPTNLTRIGPGAFNRNEITNMNGRASNGILYARNPDGSEDTSRIISYGGNTGGSISNSVRTIGAFAFARNGLSSMSLPDTVTNIEESAFWSCGLSRFETGDGVICIGSNACRDNGLTNVLLGSSVTSIGLAAFQNNDLPSLDIPNSVIQIGSDAFMANRIANLNLGTNVASIGENAFFYNYIENIVIPESATNIGACAFYTQMNGTNALTTNIVIGANVRTVGAWAFHKTGIQEITLPASPVWNRFVFGSWMQNGSDVIDANTNQPGIQGGVDSWYPYVATYDAEIPVITQNISNRTVLVGSPVSFSVNAGVNDGGVLSFQWVETDESNSVSDIIVGETNHHYQAGTGVSGEYYYFCILCNSNGAVNGNQLATNTSHIAHLTVEATQSYANWCISQGLPESQRGRHDNPMGDGFENIWKYAYGLPAMETVCFRNHFVLTIETTPPGLSLTFSKSKTSEGLDLLPIRTDQLTSNVVWWTTGIATALVEETVTSETWKATTPLTNGSVFLGLRLDIP